PPWLVVDGLLAQFGTGRAQAVQRYAAFVADGVGGESVWRHLNRQVFCNRPPHPIYSPPLRCGFMIAC
ncbi:MAG: hypothetical protein U1C54_08880, partial [Xanthomonadaceae bacterium]|nr:hypothetical protein [Xanthomonadaceae bacterium]